MNSPPTTCPFCALRCDDLQLALRGDDVESIGVECPRALAAWRRAFAEPPSASPRIDGRTAAWDRAIETAAERLGRRRRVMVAGTILDLATARSAVRLAEQLGGTLRYFDPRPSLAWEATIARDGLIAATLGEVRQRADGIVLVGDVVQHYPRLLERFLLPPRVVPSGAAEPTAPRRYLLINAPQPDLLPPSQVERFEVAPSELVAFLATWRAGLRDAGGTSPSLRGAHYTAFLLAPDAFPAADAPAALAMLIGLVAQLNRQGRAVIVPLSESTTLQQVTAWQTGMGGPLQWQAGMPTPLEPSGGELGAPGSHDGLLWVAPWLSATPLSPPSLSPPLLEEAAELSPADVVIGAAADPGAPGVWLPCGIPGIDGAGMTLRGDGSVALPLRRVRAAAAPSAAELLQRLGDRLAASAVAAAPDVGGDAC